MRKFKKVVATLLLYIMSFNIFADGTVVSPGQQATVTIAPNGVPIVNINAPDKGISVTNFNEFNVPEKGQIINNADNTGRSYLGGLVPGNPNYSPNTAAQLIILQVNGSNRTNIEGYLEVLSRQTPNVILSNENGIYINGGGTIGINQFTATTGKVNLVDGQYVGINTRDGSIIIGPKGFDGSTADYVNFIARNIEQSGKVVSKSGLTYIAGVNNVLEDGSIQSQVSSGSSVAIDASNLGGMYSGVVKVISTERGAGVNIDGYAVATGGTLEITADGQIRVNKVQGKDINVKGAGYTQNDIAYTEGNMNVEATNISLNGTGTQALGNILLNGNVTNNANMYTQGTLTTGSLTNTKEIQSSGNVLINGGLINTGELLTNGKILAKNTNNSGTIYSGGTLGSDNLINSGIIQSIGSISTNGNLNNTQKILTDGKVTVLGNTTNDGEIYSKSDYLTNNLTNRGILQSGENIKVTDSLKNDGELQATNKLEVTGIEFKNTGKILADNISGRVTTTTNDGKIIGSSSIVINSQTLNNTKEILSNIKI